MHRGRSIRCPRQRLRTCSCGPCATRRAAHGCLCSPLQLRPAPTAALLPGQWRITPCRMPWSWPFPLRGSTAWCWTRGATRLRWTALCSTVCCTQAIRRKTPVMRKRMPERKPPARATGRRLWNALKKQPSLAVPWDLPCWQTVFIRAAAPARTVPRPAACGRKQQPAARSYPTLHWAMTALPGATMAGHFCITAVPAPTQPIRPSSEAMQE